MATIAEFLQQGRRDEVWNKYCGFLDLNIGDFMEIQGRLLEGQVLFDDECPDDLVAHLRIGPVQVVLDAVAVHERHHAGDVRRGLRCPTPITHVTAVVVRAVDLVPGRPEIDARGAIVRVGHLHIVVVCRRNGNDVVEIERRRILRIEISILV